MRFKLIACKALTRELSYLSAVSDNNIDITYVRQGFHNTPDILRKTLQDEIDSVESGRDPHTNDLGGNGTAVYSHNKDDFDAILIGYGLCSNGIVGLCSKNHTLVIPRGHDCITFFLGSKERYKEAFEALPGCFWYTASWIENADLPCEEQAKQSMDYYRDLGFDEDELEEIVFEGNGWTGNYNNAAYIRMPFYDKEELQQFTKDAAEYFHWNYHLLEGDMSLLQRFVSGQWNEEDFLVVPPGCKVVASYDDKIITYVKCEN